MLYVASKLPPVISKTNIPLGIVALLECARTPCCWPRPKRSTESFRDPRIGFSVVAFGLSVCRSITAVFVPTPGSALPMTIPSQWRCAVGTIHRLPVRRFQVVTTEDPLAALEDNVSSRAAIRRSVTSTGTSLAMLGRDGRPPSLFELGSVATRYFPDLPTTSCCRGAGSERFGGASSRKEPPLEMARSLSHPAALVFLS